MVSANTSVSANTLSVRLERYLDELCSAFSPDSKVQWSSGECHSFALALAEHLKLCGVSKDCLSIVIGVRNGINPDTGRRKNVFSHALLCIDVGDRDILVDCFFKKDRNTILEWEGKWFLDDLTNPDVVRDLEDGMGWRYPDETCSEFSWDTCPANVYAVGKVLRKIEKAKPPCVGQIESILSTIRALDVAPINLRQPAAAIAAEGLRPRL